MLQLSKLISIFAMWIHQNPRHRGELLSFDPSENLENSSDKGKSLKGCFSCSSIYTACSILGPAHIYTCRCELISFLLSRVFQNLQTKDVKKAHTLCVYGNN
jgi:hypothetical protein